MCMRGIFMRVTALCAIVSCAVCLASCTRVINSASDELRMYRWSCEEENGCCVTLRFDDTDAYLHIENDAYTLDIGGLCAADKDSLTICDNESGNHYTFGYHLYGDRVELSAGTGVLKLHKVD